MRRRGGRELRSDEERLKEKKKWIRRRAKERRETIDERKATRQ